MPDLAELTAHLWIAEDNGWHAYEAKVEALDTRGVELTLHFDLVARLRSSSQAHVVAFGDDGVTALVDVDSSRVADPGVLALRFAEPALVGQTWVGEWMAVAEH